MSHEVVYWLNLEENPLNQMFLKCVDATMAWAKKCFKWEGGKPEPH